MRRERQPSSTLEETHIPGKKHDNEVVQLRRHEEEDENFEILKPLVEPPLPKKPVKARYFY